MKDISSFELCKLLKLGLQDDLRSWTDKESVAQIESVFKFIFLLCQSALNMHGLCQM